MEIYLKMANALKKITKFWREDYKNITRFLILWVLAGSVFLFIGVNVAPHIANFYAWMAILTLAFLLVNKGVFNKRYSIPLVNPKKRGAKGTFSELIVGIFTYAGFILITTGLVWVLTKGVASFKGALFENMSILSSTTPILAGVPVFVLLTYISIAVMETLWLLTFFEFLLDISNIHPKGKTLISFKKGRTTAIAWVIMILAILPTFFMYLHLSAKGLGNWVALFLVFLMALVSLLVALWRREMRAAIWFHVLANGIAIILTFGILDTLPGGIFAGTVASCFFIFKIKDKKPKLNFLKK